MLRAALSITRASFRAGLAGILVAILAMHPTSTPAHAQPDVAESARSLCTQAVGIWETQDQWAIRQLSTMYHEVSTQMSGSEFDDWVRWLYTSWVAAFALEQPCDKDVPTVAGSGSVTRQSWDTFNRCLQGGIDARRNAVETFVREHHTRVQEAEIGTVNTTIADASTGYLIALAQGAGVRTCRL
jgi:hypothetical protein